MGDAALLDPPIKEVINPKTVPDADEGQQEVPSVFSVIDRHIIGRAEISPPADDDSRMLRLYSSNGSAIVEAALAGPLCAFISAKLVEVDVIEEVDAEVVEDAGSGE